MAVTFVGAGALAGNATLATQAISCHASTLAGDILICQLINKSVTGNAFSPPDGTWAAVIATEVNDCTTAADDHQYGLYWKRATADGAQSFTFTKAVDDNVLFAGVISAWRGALTSGSPLDATTAVRTETAGAADNVTFPAFDPTSTAAHVIYMAYYGNDLTTFAAAMSADTNPDCTTRYDLETGTGNDASLACTSGDSDGTAIASRTWASASTADAGNTGVVFALVAQPAPDALLANDVASASSVSTPAVGQTHVILANDVASASSVSVPTVRQVHALLADDIASASNVSAPAIALVVPLLANDVASGSSVSVPSIGQVHALNASDAASASSVTAPAVGQVHGLLANDVASASSVSVPAAGQVHALLANDVGSASSASAPALTSGAAPVDSLLANDIIAVSSVSTPALGVVAVRPGGGFYIYREHRHKIGNARVTTTAKKKARKAIVAAAEVIAEADTSGELLDAIANLDARIAALQEAQYQADIVAQTGMVVELTAILARMIDEDDEESFLLLAA